MKTLINKLFGVDSENGWTGGQFSVYRLIFGIYLFIHFAHLVPWGAELFSSTGALPASASPLIKAFPNMFILFDGPVFVTAVLVVAAGLSLLFAVGKYDRVAALLLWYTWACLFGRNPLISNPGLAYVGLLLFVHVFLPRAPYGSWERKSDPDPNAGWRLPQQLFSVVWVLMALGYTYSGYTKLVSPSWVNGDAFNYVLTNPLARPSILLDFMLGLPPIFLKLATWGALTFELLFIVLIAFRAVRPFAWFAMLSMHLGLIVLINFADLSLGMVMLHLFTFNPAWIKRKEAAKPDQVYYDGDCGLCHGAVRFLLAEDRPGTGFRFAPLDSDHFRNAVAEDRRRTLPDSMVVLTAEGDVLVKSAAWLRILDRLGGLWRLVGLGSRLVPSVVRDGVYDFISSIRGRLFAKPENGACPILPRPLRARFDY